MIPSEPAMMCTANAVIRTDHLPLRDGE